MFPFRNLPIRRKLTLAILLTSAVALLLAGGATMFFELIRFRHSLVRELSTEAEIIAANSAAALAFQDPKAAQEILTALKAQPEIVHAALFTPTGEIFAEFKPHQNKNILPPLALQMPGHQFEKDYVLVFRHVKFDGDFVGNIGLRSDLREQNARLKASASIAVVALLTALLVALILSLKFQRAIATPVLDLAEVAHRVTVQKDYSLRATKRSDDEIGLLMEEFNQMLAQIERRERALQLAESKYRNIFEKAVEGIFQTTPDGRFLAANPALAQMLGYASPEDLIASVTNLGEQLCVDPKTRVELRSQLQEKDEVRDFENQLRRKDGGQIWVSVYVRVVRDDLGNVLYYEGATYDITERKRAEETLRRTEQVYRKAITDAGAVPYARDYKTRKYLFIGEGIERLIGYAPHEMRAELWPEIKQESVMMGETAGLTLEDAIKRVAAGEVKTWRCDMRVLTRDGQSRWISDVSVQNLDESGRLIGSMGILQDITERKQAERKSAAFALLASQLSTATTPEEAATHILETASVLIGWDCGFVRLYYRESDQMVPILTYDLVDGKRAVIPSAELVGATPLLKMIMEKGATLIDPQSRASLPLQFVPFGSTERMSTSMLYVPIRQGDEVIGVISIQRYTANIYTSDDLKLLQALADHCSGALQRIKATKELLEAEANYRTIFEGATEGIFQTTPEGKYLRSNPALARMFGYETPEKMFASVQDIERQTYVLPERRKELKRLLEWHGEVRAFEAERYRKDGSKFWMSLNARVVRNESGAILYYEGTARDITARRRLEKQLIEISDREQSRMGQDLHDGLCQHLVRTAFAANLLEKDLAAHPNAPIDHARKVSRLIDDAITQSRSLARGLYPVKLESEGFHSAMQELADNIRSVYKLNCDFESADSISINDHAVATHLYRIAQEGAINAAKHAQPKQIQIRLTEITNKIQLTVSDDGVGILAPPIHGNGMGLHIMNYRASMIGAELRIERQASGGTIVTCIFEHRNGSEKNLNQ